MLKTNLSDIFSDLNSESSVILPKSIKIKNINSVDTIANTTSSFMPQKGAYSDATSSFMPQKGAYSDATSSFMPQKGGYSDATSSFMPQKGGYLNGTNNKDIKQLISMLSATSDDNYTANSTDNTEQLKDKLFNIIQSGGMPLPKITRSAKHIIQSGGMPLPKITRSAKPIIQTKKPTTNLSELITIDDIEVITAKKPSFLFFNIKHGSWIPLKRDYNILIYIKWETESNEESIRIDMKKQEVEDTKLDYKYEIAIDEILPNVPYTIEIFLYDINPYYFLSLSSTQEINPNL
jgi:hypothetical protein